jgi:ABC-type antimicrobial peptide transport system permease subunit
VAREAVSMVAAGVLVGAAGAWLLARFIRTVLYEVQPGDPATFVAVSGALLLVAVAAALLPARRATRVDPVLALRGD